MAPTVLSLFQIFSTTTAIFPRFFQGGGRSTEEWVFVSVYVVAGFSPVLVLFLARRACFALGILAALIIPIFCARVNSFVAPPSHYLRADWSMWANDFLGLTLALLLMVSAVFGIIAGALDWVIRAVNKVRGNGDG